jgi:beta-xylosidase
LALLKKNIPILYFRVSIPTPSICSAGKDYYIVNSSYAYFTGLPIFHSTNLVNRKQIGNAMDRKEQLDLKEAGVSRGLFAPTIHYSNGIFYIIGTLIDTGGNFEQTNYDALVNCIKDADANVFVGGISTQVKGEEVVEIISVTSI